LDLYSIITFFLSVIYVVLIAKGKRWGFPFAFIASVIWAYTDFTIYDLKFDGFLQIFYAFMAIYGWIKWSAKDAERKDVFYLTFVQILIIVISNLILSIIMVSILSHYTTTHLAYLDAITTAFSIVATILLIYKYIESWIILLICNLLYVYIYNAQEAYAYVLMMVIYSMMAIYGFKSWKNFIANQ